MTGQVFGLEQQNGPELNDHTCHYEDDAAEKIPHFAHRVRNSQNAGPDDRLDDSGRCEHEIYLIKQVLALVVSTELAKILCSPFSSPLS